MPTLAKELKRAGYETVAFTGGGYLDRRYGFAKGFERYEERIAGTGPVGPEAASDSTGADDRLVRGGAGIRRARLECRARDRPLPE